MSETVDLFSGTSPDDLLTLLGNSSAPTDQRIEAFRSLTKDARDYRGRLLALTVALKDPELFRHCSEIVRAARSLGIAERRGKLPAEVRSELVAAKPVLCDWLLELLNSDWEDWHLALKALAEFRDDRIIPRCLQMLNSDEPQTRVGAVSMLGRLGTEHALSILEISFQTDPSERVHTVAAIMLAENQNPIAMEALIRAPQWDCFMASALGCLGYRPAIVWLRTMALEVDDNSAMPYIVAQSLLPEAAGASNWRKIIVDWADAQLAGPVAAGR